MAQWQNVLNPLKHTVPGYFLKEKAEFTFSKAYSLYNLSQLHVNN